MSRVLGIETSCDETSAAVVVEENGRPRVASLAILSQDVHRIFGGVVPELASRAHLATIGRVVDDALAGAGIGLGDVDGIAVTAGPGLVGALLVGVTYAKTLAWSTGLPLVGVHHLEGHLFAPRLEDPDLAPPFTALLVSGGHTLLLDVRDWGEYELLGATRDDAAGEAFDKVAVLLGLGYPGGAAIERLARDGDPTRFHFPRPMLREAAQEGPDRFTFSFSGLKTAVLRAVRASDDLERDRADLARGFQDAVLDVLVEKTAQAAGAYGRETVVLGGGVACSRALAGRMRDRVAGRARVSVASPRLNADNAAMIAAAGAWRLARGERSGPDLEPRDDLPLPGLAPALSGETDVTFYPLVIRLGPLEITGYGIMMMVGFLVGGWLIGRELRRLRLNENYAQDIVVAAVVGGVIGAKLWYVALTGDGLFARGGLVWYGGFLGGALAVVITSLWRRVPVAWTAHLVAPALAAAYALGRIGCFLVNDDYGRPTDVPWAVRFPQGYPPSTAGNLRDLFGVPIPEGVDPGTVMAVHPTQLYETGLMLIAFGILWKLRRGREGTGWLFGLYLVLAGLERFGIEFLRAKDDRFFGAFSLAQVTSVGLLLAGAAVLAATARRRAPEPGAYLGLTETGRASSS